MSPRVHTSREHPAAGIAGRDQAVGPGLLPGSAADSPGGSGSSRIDCDAEIRGLNREIYSGRGGGATGDPTAPMTPAYQPTATHTYEELRHGRL